MGTAIAMTMPTDFRYREVILKGKPQHKRFDSFCVRHPSMDIGHRAKIFAPFDALKGFSGAIASENIRYEEQTEMNPESAAELNRRLTILKNLTFNSRMARMNRVRVEVTYYVPCSDENHEACGNRGKYVTLSGLCYHVDDEVSKSILVDGTRISFDELLCIESSDDIFMKNRSGEFDCGDTLEE